MCKNKEQIASVLCNGCKRNTNHSILFSVEKNFHEDDEENNGISGGDTYQVVQCQGCETFSFRVRSWCSESDNDVSETLYPERTKNEDISKTVDMRQYNNLPDKIEEVYWETIGCFNNGFWLLGAAGVRAMVEGICLDKDIKGKNLFEKIDGLTASGILTKDNAATLHIHRYLGKEAVHDFIIPSRQELLLSIRIVEHILDDIYEFLPIKEALTTIRSKAGKKTSKTMP